MAEAARLGGSRPAGDLGADYAAGTLGKRRALLSVTFVHPPEGLLDVPGPAVGDGAGRAVGEGDRGDEIVAVQLAHQHERHDPGADHADRHDQRADHDCHHNGPVRQRPRDRRPVHAAEEPIQRPVDPAVQRLENPSYPGEGVEDHAEEAEDSTVFVTHVAWKDGESLDHRDQQHGNQCQGQHAEELAHHPGDEQQRHEGNHGCQHGGRHRGDDLAGALDRRLQGGLAHLAMRVNVLAHHDGVVDEDAQRHDEREHREQVERLAGEIEIGPGREDGERYSQGDPERRAKVEEQRQHENDQGQSLQPVSHQQTNPVAHVDRLIVPGDQPVSLGELGRSDVVVDRVDHGEQVLGPVADHRKGEPRLAVDLADGRRIVELVAHHAQLAHGEDRPARIGHQRQLGDLVASQVTVVTTDDDLLRLGADGAARQLVVLPPHHPGHLGKRQPVGAKRLLGDLDVDLVVLAAGDLDVGDTGQKQQVVADPLGHLPQLQLRILALPRRPENPHADRRVAKRHPPDLGILGHFGEAGDAVHLGADFVEHAIRIVHLRLQLDVHRARTLGRHGGDLLDPRHRANRFLDLLADALLDLVGSGPRVGNRDGHLLHVEGGKEFAIERAG